MKNNISYMIDLDGTIYHRSTILPFAKEFIEKLQKEKSNFIFFTNSPELSAESVAKKLTAMGLNIKKESCLTAGDVAIKYILDNSSKKPTKVFILGSNDLRNDFEEAGIKVVKSTDEVVDYVIIGYDRNLAISDFQNASTHIFNGAKLISTNKDETIPSEKGLIPHTGSIVAFIEFATGVKAINVGKPEIFTLKLVLDRLGCSKEDLCMIGDNLKTDIKMAERFQAKGYLVLTGLTKKEMLANQNFSANIKVIENLEALI